MIGEKFLWRTIKILNRDTFKILNRDNEVETH